MMRRTCACLAAIFLLAVVGATRAEAAASVTLAWDAPADPTVTGYVLSYGVAPGVYSQEINVGNVLQFSVPALALNQTYYFAVQSYNATGVRSTFSAEVVFQPLEITCHVTNATSPNGNPVAVTLVSPDVIGATPPVTTTCTPPSGSLFPVGNTPVNCSATDVTGTVSCTTVVTVTSTAATPPTVSMTAPANGATVTGTAVTVSANATDNVGVVGVQFKLDGVNLGAEDTTSPYTRTWNTTTTTNGSHVLTAVARDAAGSSTTSTPVTVTVTNTDTTAPTVSIAAPANGATVSGAAVAVSATAADNVGVVGVQFKLDGANLGAEDTASPYSISWNTTTTASGNHTLTAVARDAAGNTTTSTPVTVTVPAPAANVLVSDTFTGTNGTLLTSHAPDVNQTGHAWTVIGAPPIPTLVGGRATVIAGTGHLQTTIDSGVSDIQMATDYVVGSGPGLGALVFRLTDADNFLLLMTFENSLEFYRRQAGVWTFVASQPLPALVAGSTHRLEVHAVGSSVQGWWDGGQVLQLTEPFQQTATRHGLDWNTAYDTTTAYDNFTIINAGAPPPVVSQVAVTPNPVSVSVGANGTATAQAFDASHVAIPNVTFTWATGNAAVATVSSTGAASATVTAVTTGSTTLTATAPNNVSMTVAVAVSGVASNLLVSDTFTGSDGMLLTGHAPDVNQTGHAWTVIGAPPIPTLVGGRATVIAGTGHLQATIDSGASDIQMATDYVVGSGPGLGALAFRLTDADNFLLLMAFGNSLQFYHRQAGVWTLVASQPIPALMAGSTHRLEVHAVGSSVQGWWDGGQVLQVTEPFQQTATRHGLDWNTAYDTTTAYDNFTIINAGAPPPPPPVVAQVTVTPNPVSVSAGSNGAVTAQAFDASHVLIPNVMLTWATGNAAVTTVSSTGAGSATVTGVTAGSTTLTATAPNNVGTTVQVTVTAVASSLLVSDTFTGTNGTPLTSHAPDVNQTGHAWTVIGAPPIPTLVGGRATVIAGTGHLQTTIDSGASDIQMATDYVVGSGPGLGALAFRLTDADNFLLLMAFGNSLQFYRHQGGVWTLIASQPLPALMAGSTHRLEVHAVGSSLQGWWDGGQVLQVTEPFQQTATRHGLDWNTAYDTTTTYDNFTIINAGAPPPPPPVVSQVTVTPNPVSVGVGGNGAVTAQAFDASHIAIPNVAFTWATGNAAVATVSSTGAASATVAGVTTGSTTLTATAPNNVSMTVAVTVTAVQNNVLVSDTFTGAGGTLLTSHTPDVNQTGHAWTVIGGTPTPTLAGGRATVAAGSGHLEATIDSGASDIQLATDYVIGAGPGMGGLAFRLTDADNFLLMVTYANDLQFYRRQAGVWTLVTSQPLPPMMAGTTHRLEVHAVGSSVQGWWDGGQVLQVTEPFQQTATRHGLDWNSAYDTTTTYDNFTIKMP